MLHARTTSVPRPAGLHRRSSRIASGTSPPTWFGASTRSCSRQPRRAGAAGGPRRCRRGASAVARRTHRSRMVQQSGRGEFSESPRPVGADRVWQTLSLDKREQAGTCRIRGLKPGRFRVVKKLMRPVGSRTSGGPRDARGIARARAGPSPRTERGGGCPSLGGSARRGSVRRTRATRFVAPVRRPESASRGTRPSPIAPSAPHTHSDSGCVGAIAPASHHRPGSVSVCLSHRNRLLNLFE